MEGVDSVSTLYGSGQISMFNQLSPRFGWGGPRHPFPEKKEYEYALQAADITADNGPTDRLIKQLAPHLSRKKTGFFAITNTLALLKTPQAVRDFQWKLFCKMSEYLLKQASFSAEWLDRLRGFCTKGSSELELVYTRAELDGLKTTKTLHQDFNSVNIPLISLCYGPTNGTLGGEAMLADMTQYFDDQPDAKEEALIELPQGERAQGSNRHRETLSAKYAYTLTGLEYEKDMPLVVLDNERLLHGASQLTILSSNSQRPLHHAYCIARHRYPST